MHFCISKLLPKEQFCLKKKKVYSKINSWFKEVQERNTQSTNLQSVIKHRVRSHKLFLQKNLKHLYLYQHYHPYLSFKKRKKVEEMIYTKDWLHMDFHLSINQPHIYKPLTVSMIYGNLGDLSSLILVYLVILIP